jgi:hypothetical protein
LSATRGGGDQVARRSADDIGEMAVTAPRHMSLRVNDRVALVVDAFGPLPATVAATAQDAATLVLGDQPVPPRVLHRRAAAIETAAGGRRYRAEGQLAMAAGARGRAREDAVVFHFAPPAAPPRRVHERAPAILPVTVVPMHAELPPARGLTLNVSGGGALVRGPSRLRSGAELLLHIELPDEELPIPARGAVVRADGDGLLGVRLDRMRAADRDLVMAWVRDQQRPGG